MARGRVAVSGAARLLLGVPSRCRWQPVCLWKSALVVGLDVLWKTRFFALGYAVLGVGMVSDATAPQWGKAWQRDCAVAVGCLHFWR